MKKNEKNVKKRLKLIRSICKNSVIKSEILNSVILQIARFCNHVICDEKSS